MSSTAPQSPFVAIACGGTGGHLFPGLAVAEQLQKRGCSVALLISPKDVDQQAVKSALERRAPARHETENSPQLAETVPGAPLQVFTLPAVALQNRNYFSFLRSFWQSWRATKKIFQARPPQAVLAMGGFTSAPPVLAGNAFGAKTFLHESNTIPGRANRFLARFVDESFVGFPEAGSRLKARKITTTGTPVRPGFVAAGVSPAVEPGILPGGKNLNDSVVAENLDAGPGGRMPPSTAGETPAATCRVALGLDPNRPTILVMGGSQGASGLNDMVLSALPLLQERGRPGRELITNMPAGRQRSQQLQFLHLTGTSDFEKVKAAYATLGIKAVVKPFLAEMDLALGAATISVSRSGASSLAEIAAMRLPSLLVPYPTAADNHQFVNALAFEKSGAAKLLEQKNSTPEKTAALLCELVENDATRAAMQSALAQWHAPKAAEQIAEIILTAIAQPAKAAQSKAKKCGCGHTHGSAKHAH
ncbi:MAG TPA: UDP-N-acetylglucosamine--N-acetylmuramyl-(pentapeptide) pyrophosphoryl-undecaprenol N-acetylglucosamine transferase [Verrucomicrobiae bacterium]|nr:UDP-N-acetylglucosamine--N-acetylmuramyl-(pentapeptide) pyrophosphoryl-undecaprenol N-acetylglucosamine transferase [Verrucomicrobiae bacterium]